MSFIWNLFFPKKADEDFESILESLALDIQKRQVSLSEIRTRERRATLLTTLYTLGAWIVYVAAWYLGLFKWSTASQKAVRTAPVIIGPIVILFTRRIVQIWYARIGDKEEKTLRELLKQQRVKVEEIKKKTNYNQTRELLSRYDEGTAPGSPISARQPQPKQQQQPQSTFSTPQQPQRKQQPGTPQQLTPSAPPPPPGPTRKTWFDKLADAVLGGEDDVPRFALICEKCFAHNGLVKESALDDTQYVCPKCQHLNPSRKSRQQLQGKVLQPRPISISSPNSPVISNPNPASAIRQRQKAGRQSRSPPQDKTEDSDEMEVDES